MRFTLIALLSLMACKDDASTDDTSVVAPDDADGDGFDVESDCDDGDAAVNPDADELCDGVDNNCDGVIDDDAIDRVTQYGDNDGDGYGAPDAATEACPDAPGLAATGDDCDDGDPAIHPAADEVCDDIDNNCDGTIDDDAIDQTTLFADEDEDGYGAPGGGVTSCEHPAGYAGSDDDCDDADPAVNPGAVEVCNSIDDDCDTLIDDADDSLDPSTAATWYADTDADGYGDPAASSASCAAPSGSVADASDCDDADAAVNPAAAEICDSIDNDCDSLIDDADDSLDTSTASTWYADVDADGYGDTSVSSLACDAPSGSVSDGQDCDDGDATVNPSATELCDDIDNDCDGTIDVNATDAATWYTDADGDGYGDSAASVTDCDQPSGAVSQDGDCDDADDWVYPGAVEICDGQSNDCDDTSWTSDAGMVSFIDSTGAVTDYSADFSSGSSGSPTAVVFADDGDLNVCEGTYYVGLEISALEFDITGPSGSALTILSGGDADNVIELPSDFGVYLFEGVTITEGYGCYGPGIAAGSVNSCSDTGASFSYHEGMDLALYDVVVTDNNVQVGGYTVTMGYSDATLYMEDSQIVDNGDAGLGVYQGHVTCVGSAGAEGPGIWGNSGYGVYHYAYDGGSYSFTSTSCDFGTSANGTDNSSSDVRVYGGSSANYSYGDDETFTCSTGTGACQ